MRRLGIVAVGLALVVGVVVGGMVGNPFGASAQPSVPNPGHDWSAIGLPGGTWPGLDADKVDGLHAADLVSASTPHLYSGTQSADYICTGGDHPTCGTEAIPGLSLTFTVGGPTVLDISHSGLEESGSLFGICRHGNTEIFVDGVLASCPGGACTELNSCLTLVPTSNAALANVGAGTHSVDVRLYCDGAQCKAAGGYLIVRAYGQ